MDAHGVGSASTYARRYALSAALGVAAEDEDGNSAQAAPKAPWKSPAVQPKPASPIDEAAANVSKVVGGKLEKPKGWVIPLGHSKGKTLDEVTDATLENMRTYFEGIEANGPTQESSAAMVAIHAEIEKRKAAQS